MKLLKLIACYIWLFASILAIYNGINVESELSGLLESAGWLSVVFAFIKVKNCTDKL